MGFQSNRRLADAKMRSSVHRCMKFWTLIFGLTLSSVVFAQTLPGRPVRIIVPFPPGGGADALARLMAPRLAETWHAQVIVENHPGASGNIGADMVAQSTADGNTRIVSLSASTP